jgi:hypothetical protein
MFNYQFDMESLLFDQKGFSSRGELCGNNGSGSSICKLPLRVSLVGFGLEDWMGWYGFSPMKRKGRVGDRWCICGRGNSSGLRGVAGAADGGGGIGAVGACWRFNLFHRCWHAGGLRLLSAREIWVHLAPNCACNLLMVASSSVVHPYFMSSLFSGSLMILHLSLHCLGLRFGIWVAIIAQSLLPCADTRALSVLSSSRVKSDLGGI